MKWIDGRKIIIKPCDYITGLWEWFVDDWDLGDPGSVGFTSEEEAFQDAEEALEDALEAKQLPKTTMIMGLEKTKENDRDG